MLYRKITFRRQRRAAAKVAPTATALPPLCAAGDNRVQPADVDTVSKSGGGGFVRKLARRFKSKHNLRLTRRPPLTDLSFDDDSDVDSETEHGRVARDSCPALGHRPLPSPSYGDRLTEVELHDSINPSCPNLEEPMRRQYRMDEARRASSVGRSNLIGVVDDLSTPFSPASVRDGVTAHHIRRSSPISIAPPQSLEKESLGKESLEKAARREVIGVAFSGASNGRHSTGFTADDVSASQLVPSNPASISPSSSAIAERSLDDYPETILYRYEFDQSSDFSVQPEVNQTVDSSFSEPFAFDLAAENSLGSITDVDASLQMSRLCVATLATSTKPLFVHRYDRASQREFTPLLISKES